MGRFLRATIVIVFAATLACDDSRPPSSPPPSSGGETVTGRERVGWVQAAENPGDLAAYQYAAYVDGARQVLTGVTCSPGAGITADCTAPLPQLTAGQHTLQIVAFFMMGDAIIEGPRSPSLMITVASVMGSPGDDSPHSGPFESSDGLPLFAEILTRDLDDPVDLGVDDENRVFVAERAGRIRIIDAKASGSRESQSPAIGRDDQDANVLSLTLGADFAQSRFVYVTYSVADHEQPALRVVRLREVAGSLGERAPVASIPVASAETPAVIRSGPDGTLYIGVGSGPHPDDAQRLASPAGKILRINADGSTPGDNPSSSPVFSYGHRDPRGLAWHAGGALWEAEQSDGGDEMNVLAAGANFGSPIAASRADPIEARRRWTPARIALPEGTGTSGLALIGTRTHPLSGDLIVSTLGTRDLLRIRLTPDGRGAVGKPAHLVQGRFGRIAQVAAARDGTLYFITANPDTRGAGADILVRLSVR